MRAILDLPVSVWTVRRRFRAAGLPARRPAKKPFLTKRHKKARLEWARLHESWTPEDWRHVVWCDETGFRLWSDRGPRYVRRKVGERYRADKVVKTVKKGGGKILAWLFFFSGRWSDPSDKWEYDGNKLSFNFSSESNELYLAIVCGSS